MPFEYHDRPPRRAALPSPLPSPTDPRGRCVRRSLSSGLPNEFAAEQPVVPSADGGGSRVVVRRGRRGPRAGRARRRRASRRRGDGQADAAGQGAAAGRRGRLLHPRRAGRRPAPVQVHRRAGRHPQRRPDDGLPGRRAHGRDVGPGHGRAGGRRPRPGRPLPGGPRPARARREHLPGAAERPRLRVLRRGPAPGRPAGRRLLPGRPEPGRRRLRQALRLQQPGDERRRRSTSRSPSGPCTRSTCRRSRRPSTTAGAARSWRRTTRSTATGRRPTSTC